MAEDPKLTLLGNNTTNNLRITAAKSGQTACRTTVTKHAKPYIMRKTNLFHTVTHCSCNFSSGVLIENLGNLYHVSLGNLTHLLGNLGKPEETFTM